MEKITVRLKPLSFLLILLSAPVFSQTLSGTLIDKKTNQSIPFADVQIGQHYGVVTNSEGDFRIKVDDFSPKDSLRFSSMGYREKAIAIKDYKGDRVYLVPQTKQLEVIFLQGEKPTARQVMDSVKSRLEQNYQLDRKSFTVFRRNKTSLTPKETAFKLKKARNLVKKKTVKKFNKTLDSLSVASRDNTSTAYSSVLAKATVNQDSLKLHLNKATRLVNEEKQVDISDFAMNVFEKLSKKLKTDHTFRARTGLFPIGDSIDVSKGFDVKKDSVSQDSVKTKALKKVLADQFYQTMFKQNENSGISIEVGGDAGGSLPDDFINEPDDYDYNIEGVTNLNGHFVYEISFKPHHNFFGNKGKYAGTLYVSTDDFGILKESYALAEGEHGQKFNMKFLLGIKYVERAKSGLVLFQKTEEGTYFPKYIRFTGRRYAYLSRSFVLKENDEDRSDRIKLKFKFTFEFDNGYQDEWLLTDLRSISKEDYQDFNENEGVPQQQMKRFNPEIWEQYNTIAPTKAVRDYDGED